MYGVNRFGIMANAGTCNQDRPLRIRPDTTTTNQALAVRDLAMHNLHNQGWPMERIGIAFALNQSQVSRRLKALRRNLKALA